MSDRPTLRDFAPVRDNLPLLVPPAALVGPDVPPAGETAFLHADARPSDPKKGAAIIAVIDHAIPFAHSLFTTDSGHSRFASIWLMEAAATERRADIAFGRELRGPDIDAMRVEGDPGAAYRACGLASPGRCMSMAHADSHGAAVAALAGGFRPIGDAGRQFPLLGVSLPRSAMAETSGSLAAFFIQSALVFIIARARALAREISAGSGKHKPALVVNLSLGVTAGPQDGSGPLARLLDDIGKMAFPELGGVHFVLPTGNHRQDCLRAHLKSGDRIGWNIPPADPTPNAVEIWSALSEPVPRLAISTPSGARLEVPLTTSGAGSIVDGNNRPIGRVVLQRRGGNGGRICQTVILHPTLPTGPDTPWSPPGLWCLHLVSAGKSGCDLVIHRDDRLPGFRTQGRQSRLVDPTYARRTDDGRWPGEDEGSPMIRRNGTVSAYARGTRPIRVGAGLARPAGRISPYSGLLPDGLAGDVVAPADASPSRTGMIVPSITPAGRQRLSGTSLAAPQVARWLAARLSAGDAVPDRGALRDMIKGKAEDDTPLLPLDRLPWQPGLSPRAEEDGSGTPPSAPLPSE